MCVLKRARQNTIKTLISVFLIIIVLGIFVWGNLQFVSQNPGGNDFLVHWMGAKSFIEEGISPYSDTVALRIQTMVYGRAANPGEHELRVAYPLYSFFLFMPFGLIKNYDVARALWMTLLELGILFTVIISLKLVNWRPGILFIGLIITFSFFWYHGLRSLINGNAVILIMFCTTFSVYSIIHKQDELAGIAMALTMIKPQVVFAILLFIVIWSIVNRRGKIAFWFFGSMAILSLLAFFLLPDWPIQFLREVMRYPDYNPAGTPAQALAELLPGVGKQFGLGISIISGLVLIFEGWLGVRSRGIKFVWVCSLFLVLGQWLNVQTDPGNYIMMLPAIILVLGLVAERWSNRGTVMVIIFLFVFLIFPWFVFLRTVVYTYQPVQSPIMFFPVPVIILVLLYWVRWWAKNPIKHVLISTK
ncbi:MAG: hypothetical protein CVU39_03250 [Chloroflexi bacterium HGW-Chloroflexi-10]|nr:MAG: hypothetical protein CVU39_03250 [Chloroflexi bacterium HGW-Chloroflexi-10]